MTGQKRSKELEDLFPSNLGIRGMAALLSLAVAYRVERCLALYRFDGLLRGITRGRRECQVISVGDDIGVAILNSMLQELQSQGTLNICLLGTDQPSHPRPPCHRQKLDNGPCPVWNSDTDNGDKGPLRRP
jgi:hypothetical protein